MNTSNISVPRKCHRGYLLDAVGPGISMSHYDTVSCLRAATYPIKTDERRCNESTRGVAVPSYPRREVRDKVRGRVTPRIRELTEIPTRPTGSLASTSRRSL